MHTVRRSRLTVADEVATLLAAFCTAVTAALHFVK